MDYPHFSSTFLNSLLVDWLLFNGWNNNLTFQEGGVGAVFFLLSPNFIEKYLDLKFILNLHFTIRNFDTMIDNKYNI
jgi:hypothetical protein